MKSIRYVVEIVSYGSDVKVGRVLDKEEKRYICSSARVEDVEHIAKILNLHDRWEPITLSSEEITEQYKELDKKAGMPYDY